jgi:hypothetical protein
VLLGSPREQIVFGQAGFPISSTELGVYCFPIYCAKNISECFLYGSLIMQIDFDLAADAAKVGAEPKDQQIDPDAENETVVAANDDGLRWPLIPFPKGWYASF